MLGYVIDIIEKTKYEWDPDPSLGEAYLVEYNRGIWYRFLNIFLTEVKGE